MNVLRSAACLLLLAGSACRSDVDDALARALTARGTLVCLGQADLCARAADGTTFVAAAAQPLVAAALQKDDVAALAAALAQAHAQGIVVDARPKATGAASSSVAGRIARYERLRGLTGVHMSPDAALYTLDPTREWSESLRAGIALVARRLLAGQEEPRLTSFPEPLRRVEPVEVMVLLRIGSRARLWRSARGSSFARALLTAADVARRRWDEREQAMGGPLAEALPSLTVEVSLLVDDGELGSHEASFVDRAVGEEHGVAYEQKGAWRYVLPEATHTPRTIKPSAAYARLFEEDGLPSDSLGSRELRLYRMAVSLIGVSEPLPSQDELAPVSAPADVLGE